MMKCEFYGEEVEKKIFIQLFLKWESMPSSGNLGYENKYPAD